MMTAKEYVEGKVKSYTRLAERCRREAEASDDIVVRAEYSARASVWEMCAEEMDNVREILEEESGGSRMPDTVHHVMRYTVYDAKKEEPARVPTRTSSKSDESRRPSPQK